MPKRFKNSTLKLLKDRGVVNFRIWEKDRRLIVIEEAMDYHSRTSINKDQLGNLIEELKVLHEQMENR